MALGDAYLTVDEFKTRSRSLSGANDDAIAAVLESASRQIDGYCGREFNQSDGDEYRIFDDWHCRGRWRHAVTFTNEWPGGTTLLELPEVVSITEIASDEGTGAFATVWDVDSYVLTPRNAAVKGKPYREVQQVRGASWPLSSWPIRIAGIWGWPAVPAPVKEVTFMLANRLKSLWDAPFGLSGGGEMGALDMTVSLTPILKEMLRPYKVVTV